MTLFSVIITSVKFQLKLLKEKVKSSMARSLPVENLLPQNVGSIINHLQKSTEATQCGTPSCSRPQPGATMASETVDPIDWSHPHPHWQYPHERLVHSINECSLSMESTPQPSACEATTFPLRPLRVLSEKILLPYQAAKTIIACGHHYQRLPRVPSEIFSSLPLAS